MAKVFYLLGIPLIIIFITPTHTYAHIDISPQKGEPNKWGVYSINVPTEVESPTTKSELVIPPGYEVEAIGHKEKWSFCTFRRAKESKFRSYFDPWFILQIIVNIPYNSNCRYESPIKCNINS